MSVEALAARPGWTAGRPAQLCLAIGAVLLVGGIAAGLVWGFAPPMPVPRRNPFGMGLSEAGPSASALGRMILSLQSSFYQALKSALSAVKADGGAIWPLVGLGFAYGVFHAAGPGHGKAVIGAYIMSSERALSKAVALSLAAALIQALVAIGLVGGVFVAIGGTAPTMTRAASGVESAGFALVAAIGAVMLWRKAGLLLGLVRLRRDPTARTGLACSHVHLPGPERLERVSGLREMAAIALGAGIRPCSGAILVLVFALAQHLVWAGILATLAMGLGTAITTGLIATIAVYAKRLALRLAGGRGLGGALALAGLELAAAAFVVVIGLSLVTGISLGEGGI